MAIRFYNTMTRKTEEFLPLGRRPDAVENGGPRDRDPRAGQYVRMYHCGPTVYSSPHIGNFRSFLLGDVLRRFLEYRGFDVHQVMNITDVGHLLDDADEGEDKLEVAARKEKVDPMAIAARYTDEFFVGVDDLGFKRAHEYPRATDNVPQMIEMIEKLIEKGYAYVTESGNVYFDVSKFERYGELSANSIDDLVAGHRVETKAEKKSPVDFALWKRDPHHLMQWPSPWGEGFPGWHIECSAMSRRYLGDTFDIHTGGEDNIFPHHECEIAQSEAANGVPFVRMWLHARHLLVNGEKMSKSQGNFFTLQDLKDRGFSGLAVRHALSRVHYRQPMNFTLEGMSEAQATIDKLTETARRLREGADFDEDESPELPTFIEETRTEFVEAMSEDLNVSAALAAVHKVVSHANRTEAKGSNARTLLSLLEEFDSVLGFLEKTEEILPEQIEEQIRLRQEARANKDWATADRIRDELKAQNIEIMDSPDGKIRWRRTRA